MISRWRDEVRLGDCGVLRGRLRCGTCRLYWRAGEGGEFDRGF